MYISNGNILLFLSSLFVSSSMKEPKVHIQPKLSQVTVVNVKLVIKFVKISLSLLPQTPWHLTGNYM